MYACVFCGKEVDLDIGWTAWPVRTGRCCADCFRGYVEDARQAAVEGRPCSRKSDFKEYPPVPKDISARAKFDQD